MPYLDLVLYDLKHMDSERHQWGTRVSNTLILENLRRLAEREARIVIRVPLIPSFNDASEHLHRLAAFVRQLGIGEVHILPYHSLGNAKYRALGRFYHYQMNDAVPTHRKSVELAEDILRGHNLEVTING